MEWEFSAEQVVKGEVAYPLEDFRRDLATEVRMNTTGEDEHDRAATFNLVYDLCHWLATGKEFEAFLATCAYDPPTCEFLSELRPLLGENVEMLGAILQRMIMDGVEAGLPLEKALARAAEQHRRVADGRLPDASG